MTHMITDLFYQISDDSIDEFIVNYPLDELWDTLQYKNESRGNPLSYSEMEYLYNALKKYY